MNYRRSRGEKLFNVFNVAFLALVGLAALYPFIYTLNISLSTAAEANRDSLHLFPREVSFTSYKMVLCNPQILVGFRNSLLRTVLGTLLTMVATCIAAYPLAQKNMPHRRMIVFLILFTMVFTGGLVPHYILIRGLGLLDTLWALLLPTMLTAFNIIVMKNFFQSVPQSLAEAGRIDGAGEWRLLFQVYVPLSKPVLATVTLWTAVLHWNSWFDAMLYINDNSRQVLQTFLQRIVLENSTYMLEKGLANPDVTSFTPETIKAATVIITVLPMLILYPFVQKYFVKGIMLGSVKE